MCLDLSASICGDDRADGGSPPLPTQAASYDGVLMVFMLSAVPPEKMRACVRNAFSLLKPGGKVFFRDYGLFDLTQLRFPADQKLATKLYYRGDGTLSYFFSSEELAALFEKEGFTTLETDYVCVELYNRKKDFEMRRVFAHAVFQKPLQS